MSLIESPRFAPNKPQILAASLMEVVCQSFAMTRFCLSVIFSFLFNIY